MTTDCGERDSACDEDARRREGVRLERRAVPPGLPSAGPMTRLLAVAGDGFEPPGLGWAGLGWHFP